MQTQIDFLNTVTQGWELRETPAYKLSIRGTMAVSDLELLSTMVGSARAAKELMKHFGSLRALAAASVEELMQVKGMNRQKSLILVSAFEICRRKAGEVQERAKVTSSDVIGKSMIEKFGDLEREVFCVIFLNRGNEAIAEEVLFTGGLGSVNVDPRIIFKKAITHLASAIIMIHNHPSGTLVPSQADMELTRKVVAAGQLMDVVVLDHLIVSHKGYYSFADDGKI